MDLNPEIIRMGQFQVRFLVDPAAVGRSLSVYEAIMPVGDPGSALHSHADCDETVYGLEGRCTFTVDGRRTVLSPGEVLFIPRGAVHRFVNESQAGAKILTVMTPGLVGPQFFRDLASRLSAERGTSSPAFGEILARHGMTVAAPSVPAPSAEEQMKAFEKDLKENDWGHQPC